MTYCDRLWTSVYTYLGIWRRLRDEEAMPASAIASTDTAPDESTVHVVATVNLTQRQGKIQFVNPVPNLAPTAPESDSSVVLRFVTRAGKVVGLHPAPVKLDSELGPDEDRVGLVDAVVSAGPDARVIELVVAGRVVDTFRAGGALPVARVVRAVPFDRQRLKIAVDLDRPPDEGHTFSVQVSTDQGRSWQTVGVGLKAPSLTVDPSQFALGQELLVRVIVTNGFASSVGTSEVFWL
ncbi:hypothetical protein ACFY04_43385 [Streptomyces sp. NPDC001549]|uniref:hypothetical protein n=1 Tax=Streptomyces sp. NPDC001549 TaxID=3364586 RepID=UPI0036BDA430